MPRPWPRVVIFSALLLMPTAGIDLAHGGQSAETPVDCSEGGRSQLEMNVCAGRDADAAQARLETLLVDLRGLSSHRPLQSCGTSRPSGSSFGRENASGKGASFPGMSRSLLRMT